MTDLTSLARPYAQAAFEYAAAQQQLEAWSSLLTTLAQWVNQPTVQNILNDPRYSTRQLIQICLAPAGDKLDEPVKNLLQLLAERRRLILLPLIAQLFTQYRAVSEQRVTVTVYSAMPLVEREQHALQQTLAKQLQATVELDCRLDPQLLSGLRLQIGDKVIDNSLGERFARLKTTLLGS